MPPAPARNEACFLLDEDAIGMLADASFFPDEPVKQFNMYEHKTVRVMGVFWNHIQGPLGAYRC